MADRLAEVDVVDRPRQINPGVPLVTIGRIDQLARHRNSGGLIEAHPRVSIIDPYPAGYVVLARIADDFEEHCRADCSVSAELVVLQQPGSILIGDEDG